MKKILVSLTVFTLLNVALFINCNGQSDQKVENKEKNASEAKKDLDKANEAYKKEIKEYRKEIEKKIEENNKSIKDFNKRIESEKKDAKADYEARIIALEKKNNDMKKRMDDYADLGKDQWSVFKAEFSRDMEELGKAFKDLTIKNTK